MGDQDVSPVAEGPPTKSKATGVPGVPREQQVPMSDHYWFYRRRLMRLRDFSINGPGKPTLDQYGSMAELGLEPPEDWHKYEQHLGTKLGSNPCPFREVGCLVGLYETAISAYFKFKYQQETCELASRLLTLFIGILYTVARLILLVISFTSLRSVPERVHEDTLWTGSFQISPDFLNEGRCRGLSDTMRFFLISLTSEDITQLYKSLYPTFSQPVTDGATSGYAEWISVSSGATDTLLSACPTETKRHRSAGADKDRRPRRRSFGKS
jgi:hypothetical protein